MKSILFSLIVSFIVSCSTQKVSVYEKAKLLQIYWPMEWRSIDTFNDEYSQKAQGEINTIPFYFSLDEQKKLIEEINRVDFMNLPDTLILKDSLKDTLESINFILPVLECEIEYNGQLKKVFCSENGNIRSSKEYMRLQAVLIKINEIIQGTPE